MEGNQEQSGYGSMSNGAAAAFGFASSNQAAEELPPMRAVSLSSRPVDLQFSAPASFGKAPALGLTPPSLQRSVSAGVAVKKEWNESNWNVRTLEQVPLGFPLERTHREIFGADANEVATRISSALKKLSVETEYDCEKAKAKCTSMDRVSFRIRLFAGGEGGLPVVVEVQRRNGSASSFMRICRQILDGAEGAEVKCETSMRKKMPPFMKGPIGNMKCLQSVVAKEDGKVEMADLNKSIELLKSKQKDTNMLGLEGLCLLTDPLKTRPDRALNACKEVVLGEQCAFLREELGVILQKDGLLTGEDAMRPLAKQSRHLALVILSHSLLLTSKDGCLSKATESNKWYSEILIPSLLEEVKSFETSANNAYEAACGLTSLASCSEVAKRVMEENSAVDDLRAAYHFGCENHELLSSEAERTLIALGASI